MYATVTQRKMNDARREETRQQAEREFFPKLRQAPGFVSMYLIAEEAENLAVVIWESKAQADAFRKEGEGWMKTLEEHGHHTQRSGGGEVVAHVTAQK